MTAPTIPTTGLGEHGPEVGAQGLGCMGMSFAYGPSDTTESLATLDRALELGTLGAPVGPSIMDAIPKQIADAERRARHALPPWS